MKYKNKVKYDIPIPRIYLIDKQADKVKVADVNKVTICDFCWQNTDCNIVLYTDNDWWYICWPCLTKLTQ